MRRHRKHGVLAGTTGLILAIGAACSSFDANDPPVPAEAAADADAAVEGGARPAEPCDPRAKFLGFQRLERASSPAAADKRPTLTADELTLFFERTDTGGTRRAFLAERVSLDAGFGAAKEVAALRLHANDGGVAAPAISRDGSRLAFGAREGTGERLWVTSRLSGSSEFGLGTRQLVELNAVRNGRAPAFSADAARLYFTGNVGEPLVEALFVSVALPDAGYGPPIQLRSKVDGGLVIGLHAALSGDGRDVYFARFQAGLSRIFVARLDADGAAVETIDPIATNDGTSFTPASELPGAISSDNCRLYFASELGGGFDLYVASRR